jgi:hypothetical protein
VRREFPPAVEKTLKIATIFQKRHRIFQKALHTSLFFSYLWLRRRYFRSEKQEEKPVFPLLFARFFVPLRAENGCD